MVDQTSVCHSSFSALGKRRKSGIDPLYAVGPEKPEHFSGHNKQIRETIKMVLAKKLTKDGGIFPIIGAV
jgi:hypothetical protein